MLFMPSGGSFLWSALEACDTIFALRGAGTWNWGIYMFLIRLFFSLFSFFFFFSFRHRHAKTGTRTVPSQLHDKDSSLGNVAYCRWHLIFFLLRSIRRLVHHGFGYFVKPSAFRAGEIGICGRAGIGVALGCLVWQATYVTMRHILQCESRWIGVLDPSSLLNTIYDLNISSDCNVND